MAAPLVAEHLTKVFGHRKVVDSVSLELRDGEVFGFLGPNGAGKTTTIRMMVGLIRPTAGSVTICGHDLDREFEAAMRCIGCIVETPDLYRFMTGRENLEHFSRMLGPVDRNRIEELAGLVALAHRLDDKVRTYSLGMRQRLGIAQALLGNPRVLILDEPANGLDPAGIREIRSLLRMLAKERGLAILVSSHLLAEIELMCDRVAIIHRGRILTTGTVAEMLRGENGTDILVDDSDRAASILQSLVHAAKIENGRLRLDVPPDAVPEILKSLSNAGVRVFEARPVEQTLEERFLAATSGQTVVDWSAE
ncbi:MAG: ABC transporter ATP-binding protein [Thermoanaerobaculia bacterium]